MGASASDALSEAEEKRLALTAERLGHCLAKHGCILITGATTGLPAATSKAFRGGGGFAVGISPAENRSEHRARYALPEDDADVLIFTGFGLKGRNVINVRSAEIVIVFGGAMGTLNEFTIAYDEGKVIGVLENSGGVADHVRDIIRFCDKPTRSVVLFDSVPESLVEACLSALRRR
jgi:uncharacterized protein (TIGR00725 family)